MYCTNPTYSSCHVTRDLYEEMLNSSDPPGTCDISKKPSLQSKIFPSFGQAWGEFFFDGMSRSSFPYGTRDISQNSSLQKAPWRVTWRVGRISTVWEQEVYSPIWTNLDTKLDLSKDDKTTKWKLDWKTRDWAKLEKYGMEKYDRLFCLYQCQKFVNLFFEHSEA